MNTTITTAITDRARVSFNATQSIPAPASIIFPLLCPVREYDWIPDWDCELVYTLSGVAEPGCVFRTSRARDGGTDTWVISRYEPPAAIDFIRFNDLRVMQYDIRLQPGDGATCLRWQQSITALSAAGDAHVRGLREADFLAGVAGMEKLMIDYLGADAGRNERVGEC